MGIKEQKLKMLDEFYTLEQKRQQILAQGQILQNQLQQITGHMDTLNKQFLLLREMESQDKAV